MLVTQIEVSQMMVFAYIVGCPTTYEGLIIDPADEADRIMEEVRKIGCTIRYIVNTHAHVDHIMGNETMKRLTDVPIIIHKDDAYQLTHQPPAMFQMFGGGPSPPADMTVEEGEVIQVGTIQLKVFHTPGHSPGGMCLYGNGAVFTGDTLFVGGVGRTDLPGGSWEVLQESIRRKLFVLPDDTIVYPGHNYGITPTSTIGKEKDYNPYL